jgi:leader peptidase (prepilin peptidase)/N-methyltransferase
MLYLYLALVFFLGAAVGSGLNVCAYRLPYEKSLLWPGSRCASCLQPVRWFDNVPLLSYWLLRGRCRRCGARFSCRYFFVELCTALAFVGLFWLEIIENVPDIQGIRHGREAALNGWIPTEAWWVFAQHAVLLSFLIVASLCDLDHMEIPLSLTFTGTLFGLAGSMLLPWAWPGMPPAPPAAGAGMPALPSGAYPWPVWYPLPAWMPAGSWQLGLATGLAGAAAGMVLLRGVRFLFGFGRGMEGLGLGDADLMMMAGAFLGWQPVIMALFVGVAPALVFALFQIVTGRGQAMPFGPPLAIGVVLTLLFWPWIGRPYQLVFFEPIVLLIVAGFGGVLLLVTAFLLRLMRGMPEEEPAPR